MMTHKKIMTITAVTTMTTIRVGDDFNDDNEIRD